MEELEHYATLVTRDIVDTNAYYATFVAFDIPARDIRHNATAP